MSVAVGAHSGREAARLMAVQALYQMDIAATPLEKIIEEFNTYRLAFPIETADGPVETVDAKDNFLDADRDHFEALLRGVVDEQRQIDKAINDLLREGWVLKRLDITLRAIMRAGTFELMFCKDIPAKVCISEYTSMAHAYFNAPEAGMANAIFEKIANSVRP